MIFIGTWLTKLDMAILDFHSTYRELALPPKAVWYNAETGAIYNSCKRRMRALERAGLLEKLEEPNGYYQITSTGIDVIEGNLSKDEINELDPEQKED